MNKPETLENAALRFPTIDAGVKIGHVHLKVADLQRALDFYCGVLGFTLTTSRPGAAFISAGGYHHHIGLNTWESRGGSPPPPGTTGLYHTAILYPTRRLLADALRRLIVAKIPLEGASATTASARRSTCAIPTTTASSFIGTGPRRCGRSGRTAACGCTPIRSICMICWPSWIRRRRDLYGEPPYFTPRSRWIIKRMNGSGSSPR